MANAGQSSNDAGPLLYAATPDRVDSPFDPDRQDQPPRLQMQFLEDERSMSERLGLELEHPVRLFDVAALGVSLDDLKQQVLPSFRNLPWDEYDAKRERVEFLRARYPDHDELLSGFLPRYFAGEQELDDLPGLVDRLDRTDRRAFEAIRPFRRRAVATFTLHRSRRKAFGWEMVRQADADFTQDCEDDGDYRQLSRRFAPSPPEVTKAPAYCAVIRSLAMLVDDVRGGSVSTMRITCHQMGLMPRPTGTVSNAPEGIHQDGADYIVSALVLERKGVSGSHSVVYGPDKRTEYLRHTLAEGQGIFQADVGSPLWHWVTPMRLDAPESSADAGRKILGFDVQVD